MKGTIRVRPGEGLAEVTYVGPVTFADRCETLSELEQRLRDAPATLFLLDFSAATEVAERSVEGLRRFIDQISNFAFAPGARVAMVNPSFEHGAATESMRHALHYHTRRFSHREAALAWLHGPLQEEGESAVGD
jgi:hypothetical protein